MRCVNVSPDKGASEGYTLRPTAMRICPQCNTPSLKDHSACPFCGASMTQSPNADPMIGQLVSEKFVLQEVIGAGGMGKVYRADQLGVGRTVAVKIMHRHLMGDETAGARFTNEARACSQLNHPNSISVLDFGQTQQGFLYIVYEYLRGRSLDEMLRREFPVPFGRVADILCQAMDAVDAAHELGIIHRDLKPENVFLVQTTSFDFVKVLDFGIAKIQALRDRSITSPGMVPGTPEYMSPEQARGESLGPTSDVYSLGIILYELLTASVPFSGESVVATMMSHVQDPPIPPSVRRPDRQIPTELEAITLMALAKRPKDRFQTAIEFRDRLASWAESAGVWLRARETGAWAARPVPATREQEVVAPQVMVPHRLTRANTVAPDRLDPPPPIIGRGPEMEQIEAFLARRSRGRMMRMVGMVGMGKARLIGEVCRRAATLGLHTVHCRPDPGQMPGVLGAARRVALSCLDIPGEPVGLEELLLAASRLGLPPDEIPGINELFGIAGHLSEMDPASRRRERALAFWQLVNRAASIRPMLLVFDGFQQYDGPSQELIGSLALRSGDADLAILISHHQDLSWSWPEMETLELQPLDRAASTDLVRSLFAEQLGEAEVEQICAGGQGLPLFIEQLAYAHLLDGETDVPEKLADLVATRTERLPLAEREVLQWISVMDDSASARSLSRISGKPVERDLLRELERKGLLQADSRGSYRFIHPLVGMVVYSSIPAEVRRGIHLRVVEHLRRIDGPAATLAFHSYEADSDRAIEELDQAGALALQCLDHQSASQYFSRALEMVRREWGKGRLREAELEQTAVGLARRLAIVLNESGESQMAQGVLEEALSVAAGVESSRAALRLDMGRVDLERGNLQRATRHLELARGDAEHGGSSYLLGEVLRELARAVGLQGEIDRAGTLLLQSLEASREAGGPRGEPGWRALLSVASTCAQLGFEDRARGYLLDALQEAENASSIPGKLQVTAQMATMHLTSNEWTEAEMRLRQALDLVAQVGDRSLEAVLCIELGRLHRIRGEVELARKELEQALRLARAMGHGEAVKSGEQEMEMLRYARPQAL